jgi:uncharacterized protein YndB with AHSA1/START domain
VDKLLQKIVEVHMTATTHPMIVTRVFDALQEQVWKAWSVDELVKQWWGPTGFTCPLANMDFREGGISLMGMEQCLAKMAAIFTKT